MAFFFQAEDGIRDIGVTGVQTCALPIEKAFDVKDPQTSLPDPHFSDGRVPSSVAGSGRTPSLQSSPKTQADASGGALPHTSAQQALPYASGDYFAPGLQEVLSGITGFLHQPQLPVSAG